MGMWLVRFVGRNSDNNPFRKKAISEEDTAEDTALLH